MSADIIEVSEDFLKVKEDSSISLEIVEKNQLENQSGFQKIMTLAYKASTALFFCGTFLYFMLNEAEPLSVLEALTYQGLLLLCLHSLCSLLAEWLPLLKGVAGGLRDVAFPVAIFISLLSWGLMIPVDAGGLATFKNHFFHTLNSASVVASMAVAPQAWCRYRCPLPLLYGLAYLGLQVGLQAAGQPARYPFLDFINAPEIAGVILFVSVLLMPTLHLLLCQVSRSACRACPPCHEGSAGKQE